MGAGTGRRQGCKARALRMLGLAGAGLGMYLALSAWLAWLFVHPMKESLSGLPPKASAVSIPVQGRKELLPAALLKGTKPVWLVLAHGYGGAPAQFTEVAEEAQRRGATSLLLSMRGHTSSPVDSVTFGPGEAKEIVAAARWAKEQDPNAIVVAAGISLGGAAVWLAAAEAPDAIDAAASDGAFARLDWGLADYQRALGPAGQAMFGPMNRMAAILLGYGPEAVRPDLAARAWKGRPGLVIFPADDQMFPRRHAELLSQESGAPIWEVPGAMHAEPVASAVPEYVDRLLALADEAAQQRKAR